MARFTDADPNAAPRDHSTTIDWGDSTTSAGFVRHAADGFKVGGLHAYFLPGGYRVVVSLANAASGRQARPGGERGDSQVTLSASGATMPG